MCIRDSADLVAAGFGQDVQQAMDRRREHLIGQGDVTRHAAVSYTHLRAHETVLDLVCRLLLEKKNHKHT